MQKSSIPNLLTYARIVAVPIIIAAFYAIGTAQPLPSALALWLPVAMFAFASITDFLDGYLARKWGVESEIGRALDPIADKLLVVITLLLLVAASLIVGLHLIPVCVIMFREIWVSGLREALAGRAVTLHVSKMGKWKTTVQMLAIGAFLLFMPTGVPLLHLAGSLLLWLAALLTLVSGWQYTKAAFTAMRSE